MKLKFALAGLIATLASASCLAEVVVIVNPKVSANPSTEQIIAVFLGKSNEIPGIGAMTPVDLKEGDGAREEFYSKIIKKDGAQLKAYWSKIVFTGKGAPPKELLSAAEVKKFVASTPGGIGYIDKTALDSTVKAITP